MQYGYTISFEGTVDEAVDEVEEKFGEKGFGILTDIDMAEKFRKKLGKEFDDYRILGACSPKHAYEAVQKEEEIGLLLPCNVIVREKDGETLVSIVDPEKMLDITGNSELDGIASEVSESMRSALDSI